MQVQALRPYIFIYCQNEEYNITEINFKPILQLGGEVIHIPNSGKESHSYLDHITTHYNDLANYTLFARDISSQVLLDRFDVSTSFPSLSQVIPM